MNYTNSILSSSFYLSSTVWKLVLQLSYVLIEVGITDITIALSHPQSHVMQTSVPVYI